ncbi:26S proteasome regulatory subunit 4 [Glycine max]|uniref:ATPase AAA-type core domain-containing protein n=1 Tax=Glycine max TaxID=3847 RepID=K7L9E4_SOYBN|nr:hypothetical protein JHK85_023284 [Glycine max]KAH1053455.1 hypothetical protein GYH30_022647 [Glycine max]KAH1239030.1 26S proteasome regulatory subunit 4 [Glycine max]
MCRSWTLDECRSCSSSSVRWLLGMRGEESLVPAPASRFIEELEARLPREEECWSSTMLRFTMKFSVVGLLQDEVDQMVSVMKVEKAPLESYVDIGGLDAQIQEIKEAIELPLTHLELYEDIRIKLPKGVILYGEPGTGKMLLAKLCIFWDVHSSGEREIQRTMLELLNQLDGFDSRGDVKVILATNRIESLDPAILVGYSHHSI